MMELLGTIEHGAFATWVRESNTIWAYPTVLTLHTVGLGLLVGANWILDLRVLGFGSQIAIADLLGSFRVMWFGFWLNALSGILLFFADATTRAPQAIFQGKLVLIALGVVLLVMTKRVVYGRNATGPTAGPLAKGLAVASILLWVAAIAAGRFMAYA